MQNKITSTKKRIVQPLQNDSSSKSSFLAKLFAILNNKDNSSIICWSEDGEKFQILNTCRFQNEVIPKYFKHKNLKSFIRQLNLHGFKKLRANSKGKEPIQDLYKHNFFRRDQPDLIAFIKRKISKPAEADEKTEQINSLIEKQKELQEQVKLYSQATTTDVYKVLVQEKGDEPTRLVLNALKIFTDCATNGVSSADTNAQTIFQLTKNFLAGLSNLTNDKVLADDYTAPSVNDSVLPEDEYCLLAKRDIPQHWESETVSEFDELASPPKKAQSSSSVSSYFTEADSDFEQAIHSTMEAVEEGWKSMSGYHL